MMAKMIVLYTDFDVAGPYVGQMKMALLAGAPEVPVVDLMHDAPKYDPKSAGYLLAALVPQFPEGAVFVGIVDPGVGSRDRRPLMIEAGGHWFVGPDNGLFAVAAKRASAAACREITWRPAALSATFHGRDLFAPVAARIVRGELPDGEPIEAADLVGSNWPNDLGEIVYIDHYGNAMTGIRRSSLPPDAALSISGITIGRGDTFSDVPDGHLIWYENSIGLVEIAANKRRADDMLGLRIGAPVLATALT